MFYTQRNRPPKDEFLEGPFEPSRTEQGGYVPPAILIESFIIAGKRLATYRQQFDFNNEDDVDLYFSDPTRRRGYDMADATQDSLRVQENMRKSKDARDKRTASADSQDIGDNGGVPVDTPSKNDDKASETK